MTLCAYVVDCDTVIDLTSYETLIRLEVDPKDLACSWEDLASRDITPPSWEIADKLIDGGVAAIIVPSFTSAAGQDAKNVAFWKWADTLPHMVRVIDDESRLPRDRSSWARVRWRPNPVVCAHLDELVEYRANPTLGDIELETRMNPRDRSLLSLVLT